MVGINKTWFIICNLKDSPLQIVTDGLDLFLGLRELDDTALSLNK